MGNAYTTNYADLATELQTIVDNTNSEFVGQLPRIIHRAQDQVQRDLALDFWRTYERNHLTAGSRTYPRQAGWLFIRSLYLPDQDKWLEQRHKDFVRSFGNRAGLTRYWAEDEDGTLMLGPIPDRNYNVEVETMQRLPALSLTNPTNWITQNAADLLLLASLIGCETFLVSPERVQEFSTMYGVLLQSAKDEIRFSGRQREQPIRSAPRPTLDPGRSA